MSRLVFCEEEATIRKVITMAMRGTAHEVHMAADGKAGLALVAQVLPDALFTDVAMPGLNGYELADALRARPDLAHIPIVFVTAAVQRSQREEAFRHGAAAILPKPFGPAELRASVEALLTSFQAPGDSEGGAKTS
ncbi:N/A [soil metagenome]